MLPKFYNFGKHSHFAALSFLGLIMQDLGVISLKPVLHYIQILKSFITLLLRDCLRI